MIPQKTMSNTTTRRCRYKAKEFKTLTSEGQFIASGTLCGYLDFVIPLGKKSKTFLLSPAEAKKIARMLLSSVEDVLKNSRPKED